MTTGHEHSEEALGTFLANIATLSAAEGGERVWMCSPRGTVTMATIHTVKGLQFPVVFVAGLEEGMFHHAKATKTPEGMEEETRLACVSMTRAMSLLYLTNARLRVVGEEMKEHSPSLFLTSVPERFVERRSATRETMSVTRSVPPGEAEPIALPV